MIWQSNKLHPLRVSNKCKRKKEIDLLLLLKGKNKQHYCLIKHFNKLMNQSNEEYEKEILLSSMFSTFQLTTTSR